MNKSDARGRHTIRGYIGEFRLAWRSTYEPVLKICADGRRDGVRYFDTEEAAEIAAWRVKNELEQPVMVRSGDRIGSAKQDAESHFKVRARA